MTCQKTHKTTNLRKRCTYWATRDLAKGTTCNTITLKKVAATVATKADLNFKILGGKNILTREAVQTFKLHTKFCFLTGQYGPR